MAFSCSIHNLSSCNTYAMAHKHFENSAKPRSHNWADDERPLDTASKWHYRVERGPDASYYDVCLYHTTMARFHKPEEDGSYRVQYTADDSQASKQFMWRVLGTSDEMSYYDTHEVKRYVPIACNRERLTTDLWFNAARRLIVERSKHADCWQLETSPEYTAWRKAIRDAQAPLTELMWMAVESGMTPHQNTIDAAYMIRWEDFTRPVDALRPETIEAVRDLWLYHATHSSSKAKARAAVMDVLYQFKPARIPKEKRTLLPTALPKKYTT